MDKEYKHVSIDDILSNKCGDKNITIIGIPRGVTQDGNNLKGYVQCENKLVPFIAAMKNVRTFLPTEYNLLFAASEMNENALFSGYYQRRNNSTNGYLDLAKLKVNNITFD